MYFDFHTFLRQKLYQATHGARSGPWLLTASQAVFYPLIHLCFAADELLYPALRTTAVLRPLFIVSSPRSGSTLLLHLLAADSANVCHRTSELIFPSLILQRWLPRRFLSWADGVFQHRFAALEPIHPIRFDHAEEDEFLFLLLGNSGISSYLFPYGPALEHLAVERFWEWPLWKRERFGRFYRRCIQRLLWSHPATRYVGKSPHFLGKIADLVRWFPDARFVHLIRSPYESIPSALSMIATLWELATGRPAPRAAVETMYGTLAELAARGERALRALPTDTVMLLTYADLVADPRAAVERVYTWLGWALTPEFRRTLAAAAERQRHWNSRHYYKAEQFFLTPDRIRRDFAFLFDRYDLASHLSSPVSSTTVDGQQPPTVDRPALIGGINDADAPC